MGRKRGPKGTAKPKPVEAVLRALDVLEALHNSDRDLRLTELSQAAGLAKPTAYRMLVTLQQREMVVYWPETECYGLGPKVLEYGLRRVQRMDLRRAALPHMRRLREETQETVTLSVLLGTERQYIEQLESPQEIRQTVELGRRMPLHSGGSGKAILAFLPADQLDGYLRHVPLARLTDHTIVDPEALRAELARVRQLGYAHSWGERQVGAASVAAPIWGPFGSVLGCLSVSGPLARFTEEAMHRYGPMVRQAALAVSRQQGFDGADTGNGGDSAGGRTERVPADSGRGQ